MSRIVFIAILVASCLHAAAPVTVTEATVTIPTYVSGPAEKNPLFYTGRTYQGAKGLVYPYPMYDMLSDRKLPKSYKQVCLENEYVKICVLPELGGRIFDDFPREFTAGRYHSLYAVREKLPRDLKIIAESDDGVIMAIEHVTLPIAGVQFHPESIMSLKDDIGLRLIRNVVGALQRPAD